MAFIGVYVANQNLICEATTHCTEEFIEITRLRFLELCIIARFKRVIWYKLGFAQNFEKNIYYLLQCNFHK